MILLWLAPAFALAQEPAARLQLDAPSACPTTEALQAELASLVGRDAAEITLPRGLDPYVVVTADGASYVLEVHDAEGARTLRDGSCSALVRAAALIIALRIDADAATLAAATAAEPEPAPAPPAVAETTVTPPPPSAPPPLAEGEPRLRSVYEAYEWAQRLPTPYGVPVLPTVSLGVGAIVEGGIVPVASASIAGNVVFRVDRFEARFRAAYVFEQGQPRTFGIAASAALGTVLACGRPFEVDFAIAFCGGIEGGPIFARSYGVVASADATSGSFALVVGAWLPMFPWRGIDVSLGAEGWARLYRPIFDVQGLGHVWETDLFGGRFGLLVHFSP